MPRSTATNADFKKVYDSHDGVPRRRTISGAQVAEYTFDTFMMIQQRAGKL